MKHLNYAVRVATLLLFCLCNLQGLRAQTLMPLPPHASVYTGMVRGYWFTAPTNFTITGLRVAQQAGTGTQSIHVFKINDASPVAFPTTSTNFTTLAYISNAPNNTIQTVNINVTAGDKIGILGSVISGTTVANSYGGSSQVTNTTTINGNSVVLYRLLYQGSIAGAAAPNYSTEPSSWSISRVEMYYSVGPPCNMVTGVASSGITMTSANLNWNAVSGSQGYEFALTTSATPPSTGAPITGTSHNATGLNVGTNYWFHIRNKCSATNFSQWTSHAFSTIACPPAGKPVITNNAPGTVTFTFAGNTNPGVVNYQYAITQSAALPTSWQTTNSTTVTVSTLIPGNTYFAHVRSNCSSNQSADSFTSFINPFPPCYAPLGLTKTGVNMHGADITWNASATVPAPQGYHFQISTNPNPPTSGFLTLTDTFYSATNLVGGQKYYVYLRTFCGVNSSNVSNVSSWVIDSVITPSSCLAPGVANVGNITPYSADLNWVKYPGIYGYEYVLNGNSSPPPANFQGAAINFNTLQAASLMSGTNYYFHLRIRCDTFNYSPWSTTPFNTPTVCNTAPSTPVLTNITPTTASFGWAAVAGAQQYQYSVSTNNVPNPNSNTFTTTNSAKVMGLNPSAPYYFHVRAYCSPDDLSEWETVPFSTVSVSVNAIAGGNGYNVIVYPNPVRDLLQVEVSGTMNGKGTLQLMDMKGKLLKTVELNDAATQIDMGGLAQGMYLLRYRDAESAGTIKLNKL